MKRRITLTNILSAALYRQFLRISEDFGAPIRALRLKVSYTPDLSLNISPPPLGNVEHGLRIFDGRFVIGSQILDVGAHGDPWSNPAPSERYARRLHSFEWLEHLQSARLNRTLQRKKPEIVTQIPKRATYLVDRWLSVYGDWNRYAWNADILSARLFYLLKNWGPLLSQDKGSKAYEQRARNLMRQLKRLRFVYPHTQPGLSRLRAACAIVIANSALAGGQPVYLNRGLDWLDDEIDTQVFLDGGHISRNVSTLLKCLDALLVTDMALDAAGRTGSPDIRRAVDRIAPFVNFMCGPDGHTFGFNGSDIGEPKLIQSLVSQAKVKARQFGVAPNSKYQRLERHESVLMMDCGSTPSRPFDLSAHLGPLAIELSGSAGPLLVNCGWNEDQPTSWHEVARATSAHSTLILNGENAGEILPPGFARRVLGDAISKTSGPTKMSRKEEENGIWLEGIHEAYRAKYGLDHRRRIYMDQSGRDIRGEDSLFVPIGEAPIRSDEIPFEIRFHLHPDVKVTLAQDENSALLIQKDKTGWRFRTDAGPLKLEKSVYLALGHKPIRTEQLVIYGRAYGDSDGQTKSNRVRWSLKRMGEMNVH